MMPLVNPTFKKREEASSPSLAISIKQMDSARAESYGGRSKVERKIRVISPCAYIAQKYTRKQAAHIFSFLPEAYFFESEVNFVPKTKHGR